MSLYTELHCHSNFSFLEGASHIEELVLRARELGYEALALTDHDGLHGAMEFAQCAHAWGLRPITGAEITLAPLPPHAGSKEQGARSKQQEISSKERGAASCSDRQVYHLTLLC